MKESMEEFEIALADCNTVPEYLSKAISVTKQYPDMCNKISWWIDGLWERKGVTMIDKDRVILICDGVKNAPDTLQGGLRRV